MTRYLHNDPQLAAALEGCVVLIPAPGQVFKDKFGKTYEGESTYTHWFNFTLTSEKLDQICVRGALRDMDAEVADKGVVIVIQEIAVHVSKSEGGPRSAQIHIRYDTVNRADAALGLTAVDYNRVDDIAPVVSANASSVATVEDRVIEKIRSRGAVGLKKYGVTLDRKDLNLRQWLIHLQEELMDAVGYVEAALDQPAISEPAKERPYPHYYELIHRSGTVLGVVSAVSDEDPSLPNALDEEPLIQFVGEITETQFNAYGDAPWDTAISTEQWAVARKLVLTKPKHTGPDTRQKSVTYVDPAPTGYTGLEMENGFIMARKSEPQAYECLTRDDMRQWVVTGCAKVADRQQLMEALAKHPLVTRVGLISSDYFDNYPKVPWFVPISTTQWDVDRSDANGVLTLRPV